MIVLPLRIHLVRQPVLGRGDDGVVVDRVLGGRELLGGRHAVGADRTHGIVGRGARDGATGGGSRLGLADIAVTRSRDSNRHKGETRPEDKGDGFGDRGHVVGLVGVIVCFGCDGCDGCDALLLYC